MDTYYAEQDKLSDEDLAANNGSLGPAYTRANAIAERVMSDFKEEHFEALGKTVGDFVADKLWDMLQNSIISDTQYNVAGEIARHIDGGITALLSGKKWALNRYVLSNPGNTHSDGAEVRASLAALVPVELQDARIKDLEARVASLSKDLEWYRSR